MTQPLPLCCFLAKASWASLTVAALELWLWCLAVSKWDLLLRFISVSVNGVLSCWNGREIRLIKVLIYDFNNMVGDAGTNKNKSNFSFKTRNSGFKLWGRAGERYFINVSLCDGLESDGKVLGFPCLATNSVAWMSAWLLSCSLVSHIEL